MLGVSHTSGKTPVANGWGDSYVFSPSVANEQQRAKSSAACRTSLSIDCFLDH